MLQIDALGNVARTALPGQEDMKAFIDALPMVINIHYEKILVSPFSE